MNESPTTKPEPIENQEQETRKNQKFLDPSMTSGQMIVSMLPPLWVMAFLDAWQARAIFLLIAIVPILFGILALNARQFILVGLWFCGLYGLLILGLWLYRPEILNAELEFLQAVAFLLVMAEITAIGGVCLRLFMKNQAATAAPRAPSRFAC